MTEAEQLELRRLRAEQRLLTARLAGLEQRLSSFEAGQQAAVNPVVEDLPAPAAPPPPLPAGLPPPFVPEAVPPPLPRITPAEFPAAPAPAAASGRTATPAPAAESLEMRIGGTWFVRVGIVTLLTTLALLGSYLYTHIVPHLGPAAKVVLLYLGAGALAGAGAWLERSRQARESARMRNYARVVLAGGLAAVYYVTYAAHFYEPLRVIGNPLVAGLLLLGWAAFMVFLADRRGSETLATVAILLGYYTSAINGGVAGFTLVSNFVLTGGAVFLLRRHLWKVFPFASLLATFGSYAFWNYFHAYLGWRGLDAPPVHRGSFGLESVFLGGYWLLFTWAAFTAREESLPPVRRAGFVSLNNGAFFLLVTWLVLGENPHGFWRWSLGFGAVLLALAEAGRRLPRRLDANTEGSYVVQGVLLLTLGFVTYFTGWQLTLMLAAESAALLAAAGYRRNRLLLGAAYAVGLLSCSLQSIYWSSVPAREGGALASWWLGLSVGGFLVVAAWWAERLCGRLDAEENEGGGRRSFRTLLQPGPAYFSFLGLGVWLWLIERNVSSVAWVAPVLAAAAVALTAGGHALRLRTVPLYAQAYLLAAYLQWLGAYGTGMAAPPAWNPLLLLAATLALGHWWQRQRSAGSPGFPATRAFAPWNAALLVLLLQAWLGPAMAGNGDLWIMVASGLALGLLAYGLATGYRALAATGQWFLLAGAGVFLWRWEAFEGGYHPGMWLTVGVWMSPLLTVAAARRFLPGDHHGRISTAYESAAMALFLCWAGEYFPRTVLFALFCLVGGGVFALGVWRQVGRWRLLSVAPTAAGLGIFWLWYGGAEMRHAVHWLGIVGLAAQQWWGRRRLGDNKEAFPFLAQTALIAAATLCAWTLVTAWTEPWRGSAFGLAAAWSIFAAAVFVVGLWLRERAYRWLGLLILAATLVRIVCVDIWTLDTLERVVSGFCLSATFLALGYLYNRHHEKWRNLL